MPYKDKEKHNKWCRENYRNKPELKKIQTDRKRLNYWRKQLECLIVVKLGLDSLYDCSNLTEIELKQECLKLKTK